MDLLEVKKFKHVIQVEPLGEGKMGQENFTYFRVNYEKLRLMVILNAAFSLTEKNDRYKFKIARRCALYLSKENSRKIPLKMFVKINVNVIKASQEL